jgi:hypothetical protein
VPGRPLAVVQTQARWHAFYEPTDVGTAGKSSSPAWKFSSWVRPLAATSRKVVTEWVYFRSTPLECALPVGENVLELEATETRPSGTRWSKVTEQTDRRALARWIGAFTIAESDTAYLESKCVAADGWTPDSCRIELRRRHSRAVWSPKRHIVLSDGPQPTRALVE